MVSLGQFLECAVAILCTTTGFLCNEPGNDPPPNPPADLLYVNWHNTPEVGGPFDVLWNPNNGIAGDIQHDEYLTGLRSLQTMVNNAYNTSTKLRAYGSQWSLNDAPYDQEQLIQSWDLNYAKIGIDPQYLVESSTKNASQLVLVQSGVLVRHLNTYLQDNGLALSTSGFGDGNRVVGAIQTGTHGSRADYGSMHDFVVGMHMILPNNRTVYLQKENILKESYATDVLHGAELLTNPKLFRAAVVGAGSFGIIHAVVLEVEELYYLDVRTTETTLQQLIDTGVLTTLYARDLGLDNFAELEQAFDLTIVINPFDDDATAVVRAVQKVDSRDTAPPNLPRLSPFSSRLSDAVMKHFNNSSTEVKLDSIPDWFLKEIYDLVLPIVIRQELGYPSEPTIFTPGELYSLEGVGPGEAVTLFSVSSEIGVAVEDLAHILGIIIDELDSNPVPTPLNIRYVQQSDAYLSLAKFDEVTAMIDFTTLWEPHFFPKSGERLRAIFDRLENEGVPHTYHLGKFQPLGNAWIDRYGTDHVAAWREQRRLFLNDGTNNLCNMFTNDWLTETGLEDGCPAPNR